MNKWLVTAVATFIASGAFAVQEQPGAADFLACQDAVKKNDFDTVIASCEKALAASKDLYASNYYLGYAYRAKKNYDKCASNFETFIQKVGSNAEAADMIANSTREGALCYARGSSPEKAITLLSKAAAAKPNDTEVQFFLGITQMRAKREGPAEQAFSKVIQLDPSLDRAYYYAGFINFNQQQWDKAAERLGKFLELKPNDSFAADAHFMVGSMIIRTADEAADKAAAQAEAKSHLETFLAAKPSAPQSSQAHYILGSLAYQAEDNAGAKGHFEKCLELAPTGAQAEEVKKFLADLAAVESGA